MNIRLEYALTLDDFYEFQRAFRRARKSLTARINGPRPSRLPLLFALIGFAAAIYALTALLFRAAPEPAPAGPPGIVTAADVSRFLLSYMVIIFAVYLFIFWLRRSRLLYRPYFAEMQKLSEPHVTEITDQQISIRQRGSANIMEWSYFLGFVESRTIFVLFPSARMGHIIPKRAFRSEEELREFREFAKALVGKQPVGFPVQPPRAGESVRSALPVRQNMEKGE